MLAGAEHTAPVIRQKRLAPNAIGTDPAIAMVIAALTLAVFFPALYHGFVDWDDIENFVANPHYRGLGWEQLRWMWTSALTGHWIPVTWMTLGLDYVLWGMNPFGYHLTNLLLHALGASLFYVVALRILECSSTHLSRRALRTGAAFAALSFAVHPLRAESVAWVTERRDVLAGVFFFSTLLTYLRTCRSAGRGRHCWRIASLGFFALALASKSIVMTLPFILLVLDMYPLRRLSARWREWAAPAARAVWLEKAPYVLLSIATGALALEALRADHGLTSIGHHSLTARFAMAAFGFCFYLWKTIVPLGLSALYELPARVSLFDPPFLLRGGAMVVLSVTFWMLRRRWPAGLAAWVVYCTVLLPVSIRVHAGHQLVADRYSYFSCLGWALIGGGVSATLGCATWRAIRPSVGRLASATLWLWLAGLAVTSVHQVQVWRDAETLWRHALDWNPTCVNCRNHLGAALGHQGLLLPAIEQFERGLALRPDHRAMTLNLVDALLLSGHHADAVARLTPVVERSSNDAEARGRLILALIGQGRREDAVAHVNQLIRSGPLGIDALTHLGAALVALDRPSEAVPYLRQASVLNPLNAHARFWLARAYLAAGDTMAASQQADAVRRLDASLAARISAAARMTEALGTAGSNLSSAWPPGAPAVEASWR